MGVKALSLSRKPVGVVVVGATNSGLLRGVLHPSSNREEDTKVVEVGPPKEGAAVMMEGVVVMMGGEVVMMGVAAVMVGGVADHDRHRNSNSSMAGPHLNIKVGEGADHHSKVVVEGMVLVAAAA